MIHMTHAELGLCLCIGSVLMSTVYMMQLLLVMEPTHRWPELGAYVFDPGLYLLSLAVSFLHFSVFPRSKPAGAIVCSYF